MVINPAPSSGAGLPTEVTWAALPLAGALASLGAPYATTVQYALIGPLLVFRGLIATPGGAGLDFVLATLPGTVPAPGFQRRLMVQSSSGYAGLNLNTDRTLSVGAPSIGDWVALDSAMVALP